ncbi:MAG: glycosyltransferase [Chitinivibrionales bacterium]|nr:glycosyltransferase [Chitinivibrionales bacterium]
MPPETPPRWRRRGLLQASSMLPNKDTASNVAVLLAVSPKDRADWFRSAIESIPRQTGNGRDVHIYLGVDGRLTGKLETAVSGVVSRCWRVIRAEMNQGLTKTMNSLIAVLEEEELVFRMDADDICSKDRFDRQVKYMHEHPDVDILGSAIEEIDEEGRPLSVRQYPESNDEVRSTLYKATATAHPTVCFRRQALDMLGGYDESLRVSQDIELWFRAAALGLSFANIQEPLLKYRVSREFYRRRSLAKAFGEFRSYWYGCSRLYGYSWRHAFPVARLVSRLMPTGVVRTIYRSKLRQSLLQKQ